MNKDKIQDGLLIVIMKLGWFAIAAQFYLIQINNPGSFVGTSINFFSYFTILTNILVSVCVMMLFFSADGSKNFFVRNKTVSAVAVYIFIVGLVYNLLLRSTWNPEGLQKFTDELLHTVIPLLFVIYWIAFVPKNELTWKDALPWLIYPLVYSVYTLIHGVMANWYPYPFIDPDKIGWNSVAINSVFVLIAFLVVSLIFITAGKFSKKS